MFQEYNMVPPLYYQPMGLQLKGFTLEFTLVIGIKGLYSKGMLYRHNVSQKFKPKAQSTHDLLWTWNIMQTLGPTLPRWALSMLGFSLPLCVETVTPKPGQPTLRPGNGTAITYVHTVRTVYIYTHTLYTVHYINSLAGCVTCHCVYPCSSLCCVLL